MRFAISAAAVLAFALTGCATVEPAMTTDTGQNPLLEDWDTPFGVPPFDRIDSANFLPAIRVRMAGQAAEIGRITSNREPASFDNTIVALERANENLSRITRVFYALNSAHSDDTIRATARTLAAELAAHRDEIALNRALFERVDALHMRRDSLGLDAEQRRLLEETHKGFLRSGIALNNDDQARLREINARIATLSQDFGQNLLAETNRYQLEVTDRADLGNLPPALVAAAAEEASRRGCGSACWVFTLQRPSIEPFLQYSPNRRLRREIFLAYANRGNNGDAHDNKAIASEIAALRAERAALMGYESHAHFVLSNNMAETPQRVYELLDKVWEPALAVARRERDALQAMMRDDDIDAPLQPWDWQFYAEKVRKARYDIDDDALAPYFELGAVRDGAFTVAGRLFGLDFERRDDLPKWHPDQEVYVVTEADGRHLAVLYMDFFIRDSKRAGAWMNSLRLQSTYDGIVTPIVTNNFNFQPPTGAAPSLLRFNEAQTLFHEFGHALHGMLSDVAYPSLAGTSVARDFVEFPSQVFENWVNEPEVLRLFARHYQTGETIPDETIERIVEASRFNQGFGTVEYLAAAYLDLRWHSLSSPERLATDRFEAEAVRDMRLLNEIIPRYRSTYFAHVFSGGYSAGYYGYLWAEVLDADAFEAFRDAGLFDRATAQRFRDTVFSRGNTQPGMKLFEAFRGRPPRIDALLERRGLDVPDR